MQSKNKLKVMTIVGTRPEIIRLSLIIPLLDKFVNHVFVHTGQNYDYELSQIFFSGLCIRKPDYCLNIQNTSVGRAYGEVLIKMEKILIKEKPNAVLILGDTNSSIAAIIAKRLKIPIYHMEAGNRCFDFNVPEEINRQIIDHLSDFNLVYTEHARRHLISEGLPHRRIYLTGSPMKEVLMHYNYQIVKSKILDTLNIKPLDYFLVSTHREENVDNPTYLNIIIETLSKLVKKYNKDIIISTHPRTRKRLSSLRKYKFHDKIRFLRPFGFFDYIFLQMNSLCTISDSGTISEESSILSFPAITIRNSMERPEAMDSGSIVLTGIDSNIILDSIDLVLKERKEMKRNPIPVDYTVENTSWRVLKIIIGTAKLSNIWANIVNNK